MALVTCPDCKAQISSEALQCPRCGRPNPKVDLVEVGAQATGCIFGTIWALLKVSLVIMLVVICLLLLGLVLQSVAPHK